MSIELEGQSLEIAKLLEDTFDHFFLTGNAGTGKSTLLDYFRNHTKKNIAVVAPTGVAAVNVRGETIHSFFKFAPSVTPEGAVQEAKNRKQAKIYHTLQTLVIDEISMVRADLLDAIDQFLRQIRRVNLPFGGVQVIMVGDLFQLPPVVTKQEESAINSRYATPFFFSSEVINNIRQNLFSPLRLLELEKIFRQSDLKFITLLNKVRNNEVTDDEINLLNSRLISDGDAIDDHIVLTAMNFQADAMNEKKLNDIPGVGQFYRAVVKGDFNNSQYPVADSVCLKTGAKVMLCNNDPDDRWVNGTTGTVYKLFPDRVLVKLEDGEMVEVKPHSWNNFRTSYNPEKDTLESVEVGSYSQMPLRLAWAITIHKSQGKTFQKVAIDFGRGAFAHGQTYVALSRCTSLTGITLLRPISKESVIMDRRVVDFMSDLKSGG